MKSARSIALLCGLIAAIPFGNTASAEELTPASASTKASAAGSAFVPAGKFEATCPEEVRTKQTLSTPVKGWSSFVEVLNSRQIFTGATLAEGHPKDGVMLDAKPSRTDSTSNETFFDLPKGKDVFLVCQYGNTLVRFIQKMPKGLSTCRIGYSETLGHVQKVTCE